jgi:hypothetical protein
MRNPENLVLGTYRTSTCRAAASSITHWPNPPHSPLQSMMPAPEFSSALGSVLLAHLLRKGMGAGLHLRRLVVVGWPEYLPTPQRPAPINYFIAREIRSKCALNRTAGSVRFSTRPIPFRLFFPAKPRSCLISAADHTLRFDPRRFAIPHSTHKRMRILTEPRSRRADPPVKPF